MKRIDQQQRNHDRCSRQVPNGSMQPSICMACAVGTGSLGLA